MSIRHYLLVFLIMFLFGSAYPIGKLALNTSLPPILFSSLRMGFVFLFLLPFWRFKLPNKKDIFPLIFFSITMGVCVNIFLNLALLNAKVLSPVLIGSQLTIPFALLASSFFLKEKISLKKWFFIFLIFFGVIIIGFDPELKNEIYTLFLVSLMALFYATSNIISRHLKSVNVTLTNSFMGLTGFVILISISFFFEQNTIHHLKNINTTTWLLILHSSVLVSIFGHMSMFYLFKFYPVGKAFPFYALFPIFGIIQTFFIFSEIPTLMVIIGSCIVIPSVYLINKTK